MAVILSFNAEGSGLRYGHYRWSSGFVPVLVDNANNTSLTPFSQNRQKKLEHRVIDGGGGLTSAIIVYYDDFQAFWENKNATTKDKRIKG